MKLSFIAYVKGSIEAVEFYKKVFDAELGYHFMNEDGTYMHAELIKNEEVIMAVGESEEWLDAGHVMQFGLNLESEEEVKRVYEILSEGAEILYELGSSFYNPMMFDLVDQYGVRWYIAV